MMEQPITFQPIDGVPRLADQSGSFVLSGRLTAALHLPVSEVRRGETGRAAAAAALSPVPDGDTQRLTCPAAPSRRLTEPEPEPSYRHGPQGLAPERPSGLVPQAEHGARRVRGDRRVRAVRGGVRVGQQGVHARGAGRRPLVFGGVPAAHARHRLQLWPRARHRTGEFQGCCCCFFNLNYYFLYFSRCMAPYCHSKT